MNPLPEWMNLFDDRQRKQINWSIAYDQDEFRHGDNGHNDKLIIAKMARIIDEMATKIVAGAEITYKSDK